MLLSIWYTILYLIAYNYSLYILSSIVQYVACMYMEIEQNDDGHCSVVKLLQLVPENLFSFKKILEVNDIWNHDHRCKICTPPPPFQMTGPQFMLVDRAPIEISKLVTYFSFSVSAWLLAPTGNNT